MMLAQSLFILEIADCPTRAPTSDPATIALPIPAQRQRPAPRKGAGGRGPWPSAAWDWGFGEFASKLSARLRWPKTLPAPIARAPSRPAASSETALPVASARS